MALFKGLKNNIILTTVIDISVNSTLDHSWYGNESLDVLSVLTTLTSQYKL